MRQIGNYLTLIEPRGCRRARGRILRRPMNRGFAQCSALPQGRLNTNESHIQHNRGEGQSGMTR